VSRNETKRNCSSHSKLPGRSSGSIPGSSTGKMLVRATFRTSGRDRVVLAVIDQVACRSGRARWFLDHARVALSSGHVFATGGAGHRRLNFATSQAILVEAVSRMGGALANFLAERTRLAHTGSSSSAPRPRLRKPSAGFLMPSKNGSELDSNFSFNHSRPNELRSGTITGVTSDVARSM
jgi:hypothetical protein